MTTQPAGTASADLCGCTRYKPHWVHGDPWCHCGHPRWDHAEGDDACNSRHTQPAGEHHTGTLNLTGEGNAPASPISDDTIEQAAKAACEFVYPPKTHRAWIDVDDYEQDCWRATAQTLLEAAYPAIRQQVAEEIAAKAFAIAEQYQATAVTHRDISIESGRSTPKGESHMRTAHAYRHKAEGAWAAEHAAHEIGGEA